MNLMSTDTREQVIKIQRCVKLIFNKHITITQTLDFNPQSPKVKVKAFSIIEYRKPCHFEYMFGYMNMSYNCNYVSGINRLFNVLKTRSQITSF